MRKNRYAAVAVALVTGGLAANTRAGLYYPTAVENGGFEQDLINTPAYSFDQQAGGWYHATGYVPNNTWQAQAYEPIPHGSGNAYGVLSGDGTNPGELFQSIGTFTPNQTVSISLLESYLSGDTGRDLIVSLYSGGSASLTYSNGYGTGYNTNQLSGATLLGSHTVADDGIHQFNASSFSINTGTTGVVGATLWLDIATNDANTALAIDNVTATAPATFNAVIWTGSTNTNWDLSTANFSNTSGGVAFANGLDAVFGNVASTKSSVNVTATVMPQSITFNNSSNSYTLAGAGTISGGTSLTKLGTGTVTLAISNSFTGPVAINAGTLILQDPNALGTSQNVTVANGATLAFQTSGGTINNVVTVNGTGQTGQGALLNLTGDNILNGNLTINTDSTINVSGGSLTVIGSIHGNGGVTKTGAGILTYDAQSYYTGDTTVAQGGIVSDFLGSFVGTNLNVSGGASVEADATGSISSANVNIGGTVLCNAFICMQGGTVNVNNGGNLMLNTSFCIGDSTLNINSGGSVSASGGDAIGYGGAGYQVQNININGGTFDISDNLSEGLDTQWNLTGGSITSSGGGAIGMDAASGFGFVSLASSTMSLISAPVAVESGTLVFTVARGSVPGGIDLEVSNAINPDGGNAIEKQGPGTLALTGAVNTSGGITVSAGVLMFGDGTAGHDGSVDAGNTITDNAEVVFNTFASQAFAGNISGSGTLAKLGPGVLTLSGVGNAYHGTNISGGSVVFASPGAFPAFTALNVAGGAQAIAGNHGSGPKNNLFVTGLSIAGSTSAWTGLVDLTNNDMVVRGGNPATVTNQIAQGCNGGAWNGSGGISSSAAATDSAHLTALGILQPAATTTFDGQTVTSADVLVKFTWYGDTNLDGKIDGSDYSVVDLTCVDEHFNNGTPTIRISGWANGDFNYDGVVNGSDYTLMDNTFNQQGAVIATAIANPTAQVAVPEPAMLGIFSMSTIGLLSRRRRTR